MDMYREVRKTMHIDGDIYRKGHFSIHVDSVKYRICLFFIHVREVITHKQPVRDISLNSGCYF